ncbi:hypothetical protein PMAA_062830 [Talaromyces marneffei ATCC 18224]|uniref:Uncharacterized protein n=1 Tax=Talaromyces marneffei (strain ATCC 18224 / CBS 334.59 / QM 7333) TaxID=441960 RepID=B6Q9X0_TALMQ|nr:hypothetical protein PMAA_062830 [Talaromyces marneffei ATCC 18224]
MRQTFFMPHMLGLDKAGECYKYDISPTLGRLIKSQLANTRARTRNVGFEIHASNITQFKQNYSELAGTVKLFGRRDPKNNIFQPGQASCENTGANRPLREYLPGKQEAALQLVDQRNIIAIDLMDEGNAQALWKMKLEMKSETEYDSQDIMELTALECIPLTIV